MVWNYHPLHEIHIEIYIRMEADRVMWLKDMTSQIALQHQSLPLLRRLPSSGPPVNPFENSNQLGQNSMMHH